MNSSIDQGRGWILCLAAAAVSIGSTVLLISGPPSLTAAPSAPAAVAVSSSPVAPSAMPAQAAAQRPDQPRVEAVRPARVGPRLRNSDMMWNWGTSYAGEDIEHTFVLHNDGDAVLHITKARPNCSCSAVVFDKAIPPGGEGKVHVKLRGDQLKEGTGLSTVEIRCNDYRAEDSLVLTGRIARR